MAALLETQSYQHREMPMKTSSIKPQRPEMQPSQSEARPDTDTPCLPFELVGLQKQPNQVPILYIRAPGCSTVALPITACSVSKHAQLDELLLRAGFVEAVSQMPIKALAASFRNFAATTKVRVLTQEGIQSVEFDGVAHRVLVKGGICHWLGAASERVQVVLAGNAAKPTRPLASHKKFLKAFRPLLSQQPRLLVVLLFALASELAHEFDIVLIALMLVGPSSIGKSIAQRTSSRLITGEDGLRQLNATPQGLIEFLQAQGAGAVYLEDAHGARVWDALCEAIMSAGNGAEGRLRSSHSRGVANEAAIRCTLIMSAEASLADTVRSGRGTMRTGLYARLLEIYPGPEGMFDDRCGHDSSAGLAMHLEGLSQEFAGVVGHAFFNMVASLWDKLQEQWPLKRDLVQAAILKHAGLEKVTGMTHRLTEALTFVGFVGATAAHHEVLPLKPSDVFKALGLLLREQVDRLKGATTPVAQAVREAVRTFIESNPGKFLPIEQAGNTTTNGLAGYIKRTKQGPLYLFIPGVFKERFVSKFGEETYAHLAAAGLLRTQETRGNLYQVRLDLPGQQDKHDRRSFVAISGAILLDDA